MKKIISVLLAAMMLLSVCMPAFAYTDEELIAKYNLSEKAVAFMREHGVDIQIFENAPVYEGFSNKYTNDIEGLIGTAAAYGFTDEQIGDYIDGLVTTKMTIIGGPHDNTGRKSVSCERVALYINGQKINHGDSQYPLIGYNGQIYIPMTFEYARMLKLSTAWTDPTWDLGTEITSGVFGIYKDSTASAECVEYKKANNTQNDPYAYWAEELTYDVIVNGKAVSADDVLNFRGVTYFPLNDRFMKDEFDIDYTYDENGISLNAK